MVKERRSIAGYSNKGSAGEWYWRGAWSRAFPRPQPNTNRQAHRRRRRSQNIMVSPTSLLYDASMRARATWWSKTASKDVESGWIHLICFG